MKAHKIMGIAALAAAILLILTTGVVLARTLNHGIPQNDSINETDDSENDWWGPGFGWHHRRGVVGDDSHPMRSAMKEALAEEIELSVDDLNELLFEGKHLYEIALEAGLSETEYFELHQSVREDYLDRAVEAGWLTEEQAEWMLNHRGGMRYEEGFPGCPRHEDGDFLVHNRQSRGRGRRW